jgi:hypothetical protein
MQEILRRWGIGRINPALVAPRLHQHQCSVQDRCDVMIGVKAKMTRVSPSNGTTNLWFEILAHCLGRLQPTTKFSAEVGFGPFPDLRQMRAYWAPRLR